MTPKVRQVLAIMHRELIDTAKNKAVLIQFVLLPVMAIVMSRLVSIEGMPENYFATLFASMYVGMAPLTASSALIAEEKEKGTLRVLLVSGIKPGVFLMGVGSFVWLCCMGGTVLFCFAAHFTASQTAWFLLYMGIGILCSTILGSSIGLFSPNQMSATSISLPFMILLSFLPMLGLFNRTIQRIASFIYTGQLYRVFQDLSAESLSARSLVTFALNIAAVILLFACASRSMRSSYDFG